MLRYFHKHFGKNWKKLKTLGKNFIANKISAAGVSYIVKENTRRRRYLWFVGVLSCIIFMGYMTLNVVLEYLSYPKMLIQEDVIMSRFPFPAVTVCSLNPISERFIQETSLSKQMELVKLLKNMPALGSRISKRKKCMKEPLCTWSWFKEACECMENPCVTEFCLFKNDSHCVCSSAICTNKKFECYKVESALPWNRNLCVCDAAYQYQSVVNEESAYFSKLEDVLSEIDDGDIRSIVELLWNSSTYDLSDVEEGLMPTVEEIYDYGVTFDTLVASCSFEKDHCHRDNFSILYHPKYGKCYMFNYAGGSSGAAQPLDTSNYGSNSGLKLLLRVSDQENKDLIRDEVGARITIHDPFNLPFVDEYGVNVRPTDMTAIGVSVSYVNRLGKPYGNCEGEKTTGGRREPYSILGCEKECGFLYMSRECKCITRQFMHGSVLSKNTTQFVLCDINDEVQKECAERVTDNLEKRVFVCNCTPPCEETIYRYTTTASELNRDYYSMVKAIRSLTVSPQGRLTYYNTSDHKSMIGVKVYYNTFQVTKLKEVKSYSWETLIANIGGNLGFFMGLTLVTFLEIFEFLWDVMCAMCKPAEDNKVYTASTTSRVFSRALKREAEKNSKRSHSI